MFKASQAFCIDNEIPASARPLYEQFDDDPDLLYKKSREILSTLNRQTDLRTWLYVSNVIAAMSSDLAEQKHIFEEAIPLARTLNDKILIANLNISYAIYLKNSGQVALAIETLHEGIRLAEEAGSPKLLVDVLFQFAKTSIASGQENESLKAYRKILDIYKTLPKDSTYYEVNSKVGYLYVTMEIGMDELGLKLQREAAEQFSLLKKTFMAFDAYYHLGMSLNRLERFPEAKLAFTQSLHFINPKIHLFEFGVITYGLGRSDLGLGNLKSAQEQLLASLIYFAKEGNIRFAQTSAIFLAKAHLGAQEYSKAQDIITSYQSFLQQFSDKSLETEWLLLQSKVFAGLGKKDEERILSRRVIEALKVTQAEKNRLAVNRLASWLELDRKESENRNLQIQNEKLQVESKLKDQEVAEAKRMRWLTAIISGLLMISLIASGVALKQKRSVLIGKMKIRRILDNIDEGLLMINRAFKIEEHYSPHLSEILQSKSDLSHSDVFETVFNKAALTPEELSMLRETLKALLDEDAIAWDLNESHLPRRLSLPDEAGMKVCALHWCPIIGQDNRILQILLNMRDITESLLTQEKLLIERARSDSLAHKIGELLYADWQKVRQLIRTGEDIQEECLNISQSTGNREGFLRRLHTLKGIARTFGLKDLSAATHDLEDLCLMPLVGADFLQHQAMSSFKNNVEEYGELLVRLSTGEISKPEWQGIFHIVSSMLPSLQDHLRQHKSKILQLDISDAVMEWPSDILNELEIVILHGLTNAIDHGFILPAEKGLGTAAPRLVIAAFSDMHGIEVNISDNGVGLDHNKLLQLWRQKDLTPQPEQDLSDILFLEGVSTAASIQQTSGRGIGLAAIRESVLRLGGKVSIHNTEHHSGSTLCILIPHPAPVGTQKTAS